MKKIMINSCSVCPYLGYTESDFYCKEMPISRDTWAQISDANTIHKLCPLPNDVR